jgi:hypothetical protein
MPISPAIRVFVSSTFSDMTDERNMLNERVFPKIKRFCEDRGVSFFPVELRWGIPEEEQKKGNVLPICLSEIDNCNYFIGLIGSRYGSVIESIDDHIITKYPLITSDHIGLSYTEIEMLYGVLNAPEKVACSSFYLKKITDDAPSSAHTTQLDNLKSNVYQCLGLKRHEYGDLTELEKQVTDALLAFVKELYPVDINISDVKQAWYTNELGRAYVPNADAHDYLDRYIENIHTPLLLYGGSLSGKTTLLTNWITNKAMSHIVINPAADDRNRNWYEIVVNVVRKVKELYPEMPYPDADIPTSLYFWLHGNKVENSDGELVADESTIYLVTDREAENYQAAFVKWLSEIEPDDDLAIVINDVQLINDNGTSKYFGWLPNTTQKNVHIFASTNEPSTVDIFQMKEWNCTDMKSTTKGQSESHIQNYLGFYGKKLSGELTERLIDSSITDSPGLTRFVLRYLIANADFATIKSDVENLSSAENPFSLLNVVYDSTIKKLDEKHIDAFIDLICFLAVSRKSHPEEQVFIILQKNHNIDMLTWAKLISLAEPFLDINRNYLSIQSSLVIDFLHQYMILTPQKRIDIHKLHGIISLYTLMVEYIQNDMHHVSPLKRVRVCTELSVDTLWHFQKAQSWDDLYEVVKQRDILVYLTKLNWFAIKNAWMHLMIHTDHSIYDAYHELCETLVSDIKNGRDENGNQEFFIYKLLSLCVDMGLRSVADKLAGEDTSAFISGDTNSSQYTKTNEYIEDFNQILTLKLSGKLAESINLAEQKLEIYQDDYETATILCVLVEAAVNSLREDISAKYIDRLMNIVIKLSDFYLLMESMLLKSRVLYLQEDYEQALLIMTKLKAIYLATGKMRGFLAIELDIGKTYRRLGKYEDAEKQYIHTLSLYLKTDFTHEVLATKLNLGNLYDTMKLTEKAYNIFIEISIEAEKNGFHAMFGNSLNNAALCAEDMGNDEIAEKLYLISLEKAKECDNYGSIQISSKNIITFYQKKSLYTSAINILNEMQDYLVKNALYEDLPLYIEEEQQLLRLAFMDELANERNEHWQNFFDNLKDNTSQSQNIRDYEKLLKNEGLFLTTQSYSDLWENYDKMYAHLYDIQDLTKLVELCVKVAGLAKANNNAVVSQIYLERKISVTLQSLSLSYPKEQGIDIEKDDIDSIVDTQKARIFILWRDCLRDLDKGNLADATKKILSIFSDKSLLENDFLPLFTFSIRNFVAMHFSYSIYHQIFTALGDDIDIEKKNKTLNALLLPAINRAMSIIHSLMDTYMAVDTHSQIEECEALIDICRQVGYVDTAALVGNLALIYRRLKNKEKTFAMHKLSAELFMAQNKNHDSLIETMNLATAQKEFGDPESAVDTLRKAKDFALQTKDEQMLATICGNIAAYLIDRKDKNGHPEIMEMFGVEEGVFRKRSEHRSLAISLINQTIFFGNICKETAVSKLTEACDIVQRHKLKGFDDNLRYLLQLYVPQDDNITDVTVSVVKRIQGACNVKVVQSEDAVAKVSFHLDEQDDNYSFAKLSILLVDTADDGFVYLRILAMYKYQIDTDMTDNINDYIESVAQKYPCRLQYDTEQNLVIYDLSSNLMEKTPADFLNQFLGKMLGLWYEVEESLTKLYNTKTPI